MKYELFVGLRYLRARRRETFISLITMISILGVMIAVVTLNVVISVMSGFEEVWRERLLGINAHISVRDKFNGLMSSYEDITDRVLRGEGVVAASPSVFGQVMVSFKGRISGVVVRGVDPGRIIRVIDIKSHVTEGNFESLKSFHIPVLKTSEKLSVLPEGLHFPDSLRSKIIYDIIKGTLNYKGTMKSEERDELLGLSPDPAYRKVVENLFQRSARAVTLPGIVLGTSLAGQLGAVLGDPIQLISPLTRPTAIGMLPKIKRFVVVGLFDSGWHEYDSSLVFVNLPVAQRFFGVGDTVSTVDIRVQDVYQARSVAEGLQQMLGFSYLTEDWSRLWPNLFYALKLEKTVYFLVLLLMVLIAAFNIISTLIMVVMEKRKDIAILLSMGASQRGIRNIFLIKGFTIGTVGTLLGAVLGYGICLLIQNYQFIELPRDVFLVSTVPVSISLSYFVTIAFASLLICLLASLYPARQAARLDPVEVIRYD